MCAQRRFRSSCDFEQSNQNLHWADFGYTMYKGAEFLFADNEGSDLSLRWAYMSEGTFSHAEAYIFS